MSYDMITIRLESDVHALVTIQLQSNVHDMFAIRQESIVHKMFVIRLQSFMYMIRSLLDCNQMYAKCLLSDHSQMSVCCKLQVVHTYTMLTLRPSSDVYALQAEHVYHAHSQTVIRCQCTSGHKCTLCPHSDRHQTSMYCRLHEHECYALLDRHQMCMYCRMTI